MTEWKVHIDTDSIDGNRASLTLDVKYGGWQTDGGYEGYGLPKDLAQWICDVLNERNDCPYIMFHGCWRKKDD
jgi:hypothetical protein